ncbi:MAG: hypothetical protein DCC75_05160 [Proteobacteria bacterium]|nr:MAG: hypothetical protein DCC75_05160 [Pseudomonadota bacterium]
MILIIKGILAEVRYLVGMLGLLTLSLHSAMSSAAAAEKGDIILPSGVTHAGAMNSFVYPVMAPQLSSHFGRRIHPIRRYSSMHKGVDLAAPSGSPIRAISSGTVVFADPYAGYGNLVVIKHASGTTSHYGHCQSIRVRPGQKVRAGDIIGTVGSSGHSTGPHLHLELRIDGKPINPASVIPALDGEAEG